MEDFDLTKHLSIPINTIGRDFFISDIHGQFDELQSLLRLVKFAPETDRLFSCGDVIDRGPKSKECLKLVEEPWFYSVLGNHEYFLLQSEQGSYYWKTLWLKNGGDWSLALTEEQLSKYSKVITKQLPLTMTIETTYGAVGILHAEYPFKCWPISKNSLTLKEIRKIVSGRDFIENQKVVNTDNIKLVLSGHTEISAPLLLGNHLYINTQKVNHPLKICTIEKGEVLFYSHDLEHANRLSIKHL
ncbi:metallophosphoesterase [Vibrio natriegens]|uniref:metallophosphoesterase n=1 Tax=Vibrio natriegens TaxID=691 RepID=UPI003F86DC0A